MALLTNKNLGTALEVVVKCKIFWVNKGIKTVVQKPQLDKFISQTGGKALLLFCSIFNPSVLNSENDYWEVWSNSKYKLDSEIKEKHENSEASKHLSETKIFPMQSSHTMSCVIAPNPVQVTRGGVGGEAETRSAACIFQWFPPLSFDSADPVSRHIARDTKQISALG